jgi:hypothetical protein
MTLDRMSLDAILVGGFYIATTIIVVAVVVAVAWVKVTRIRHCAKDQTQATTAPSD